MNGTGDHGAGERQANENAAEDRSCEEEGNGPHDGTPDQHAHSLHTKTTRNLRCRFLA
jgi:hypothetical protein